MMRRLKKIVKAGMMFCLLGVLSLLVVYQVCAAPTSDDYLLRVEVKDGRGGKDSVSVSAPLSLIYTIYGCMPREIIKTCEELELTPKEILAELEKLKGEDLVRVEGSESVRVWLDPVTSDTRKDLGYFRVHVKDGDDDIKVCIPRGLIQLAGKIVKRLDLVNRFVELPPEIKELIEIPENTE